MAGNFLVVKLTQSAELVNSQGLHARPCHMIVSAALSHESSLRVRCGPNEANGKSILELMTLSAPVGSTLELTADGPDAAGLLAAVTAVIASGFGEAQG